MLKNIFKTIIIGIIAYPILLIYSIITGPNGKNNWWVVLIIDVIVSIGMFLSLQFGFGEHKSKKRIKIVYELKIFN